MSASLCNGEGVRRSRSVPRGTVGYRRDVAVHRIDGFEADQLWPIGGHAVEQAGEIGRVVVAADMFSTRLLRMPAIIEAWFDSSENTTMLGKSRARVDSAASLAT